MALKRFRYHFDFVTCVNYQIFFIFFSVGTLKPFSKPILKPTLVRQNRDPDQKHATGLIRALTLLHRREHSHPSRLVNRVVPQNGPSAVAADDFHAERGIVVALRLVVKLSQLK